MKICDLLSWADFSTIYSDKVTGKERKKRGKNIRIPVKVILSCAWFDIVSVEKVYTWRKQMHLWEIVLTFVSMVVIVNVRGCICFMRDIHNEKNAPYNSISKHLGCPTEEFWKSLSIRWKKCIVLWTPSYGSSFFLQTSCLQKLNFGPIL